MKTGYLSLTSKRASVRHVLWSAANVTEHVPLPTGVNIFCVLVLIFSDISILNKKRRIEISVLINFRFFKLDLIN